MFSLRNGSYSNQEALNVYLLCCGWGCAVAVLAVDVLVVVLLEAVDTTTVVLTTVGGNEFILYRWEQ